MDQWLWPTRQIVQRRLDRGSPDLSSSHSGASGTVDVSPGPENIARLDTLSHRENLLVYFLTNGVKTIIVEKAKWKPLEMPPPTHH